jgi:hypothetical protein
MTFPELSHSQEYFNTAVALLAAGIVPPSFLLLSQAASEVHLCSRAAKREREGGGNVP